MLSSDENELDSRTRRMIFLGDLIDPLENHKSTLQMLIFQKPILKKIGKSISEYLPIFELRAQA